MTVTVGFSPEAAEQLVALRRYLANAGTPDVAERYVESILTYCEGLGVFPHRGTLHDEIRPGLRTTRFKKKIVIAFVVDDGAGALTVLGVFAGGQDFEAILSPGQGPT